MDVKEILKYLGEIIVLISSLIPFFIWIRRLIEGAKCQLRQEMLRTYYRNKDKKEIRQYEYENFIYSYEAYKALKGNSFIDKIYAEVKTWRVVT